MLVLDQFGVEELMYSRRIHAYGVGAPKTGTHSLAGLFSTSYHSAHEPLPAEMICYATLSDLNKDEVKRFIIKRDSELQLEFEANHLLVSFIDILISEFPSARFIVTIRDCENWLNSIINQHLLNIRIAAEHPNNEVYAWWIYWFDSIIRQNGSDYDVEDRVLSNLGLFPIKDYLYYWAEVNTRLIESIPKEKRLLIQTKDLSTSTRMITDFLGIP